MGARRYEAAGAGFGLGSAVDGGTERLDARRKPQNITAMPATSVTMNPTITPNAANVAPPATIVAPIAMSSVPTNRSFSSGRPRIFHADHKAPISKIA